MSIDLIKLFSQTNISNLEISIQHQGGFQLDGKNFNLVSSCLNVNNKNKTIIGIGTGNDPKTDSMIDLAKKVENEINSLTQKSSKGYSKETIEKMNAFKKAKGINSDEKLMHYINAWNSDIKSKSQLTEELVKEFLAWVK